MEGQTRNHMTNEEMHEKIKRVINEKGNLKK
jgi:hypothetical protein